jgi:hypothetical protein
LLRLFFAAAAVCPAIFVTVVSREHTGWLSADNCRASQSNMVLATPLTFD